MIRVKKFETEEALAKKKYKMKTSAKVKTEFIRKLIISGQKPCTRIILINNTAFFFTFFKGYRYN